MQPVTELSEAMKMQCDFETKTSVNVRQNLSIFDQSKGTGSEEDRTLSSRVMQSKFKAWSQESHLGSPESL